MTDEPAALDAARDAILDAALPNVAFDGWTPRLVDEAAKAAGVDSSRAKLAVPGGPIDLIRAWSARLDARTRDALEASDLKPLKIRQRVARGVRLRIEAHAPHKIAARRAAAFLAIPFHAPHAPELAFKTADAIWRGIGDTSADFNYYTKRLLLSGVYGTTLTYWFGDDAEGSASTWEFLDRRIEDVMRIEKAKAAAQGLAAKLPDPFKLLAGLRYPRGR